MFRTEPVTNERAFQGMLFDQFSCIYPDSKFSKLAASWVGWGFENNMGGWNWAGSKDHHLGLIFPERHENVGNECLNFVNDGLRQTKWVRKIKNWDKKVAIVTLSHQVEEESSFFSTIPISKEFTFLDKTTDFMNLTRLRSDEIPWLKSYICHDGHARVQTTDVTDPSSFKIVQLSHGEGYKLSAGVTKGLSGFKNFETESIAFSELKLSTTLREGYSHAEFLILEFDYFKFLKQMGNPNYHFYESQTTSE